MAVSLIDGRDYIAGLSRTFIDPVQPRPFLEIDGLKISLALHHGERRQSCLFRVEREERIARSITRCVRNPQRVAHWGPNLNTLIRSRSFGRLIRLAHP